MTIKEKIDLVYRLQDKYPTIHVGGSLSLYLRGLDIMSEKADIDLCSTDDIPSLKEKAIINNVYSSFPQDFDYTLEHKDIKIEVKIDKKQTWDNIQYEGRWFRCTDVKVILKYKKQYLKKGYEKHREGILVIQKHFKIK